MKLILAIIRSGSIMTNIALSGYLLFFHEMIYDYLFYDPVLEISSDILHEGARHPLLGSILFLAVIGEFVAFVLKARHGDVTRSDSSGIFLLWMFHTVVSVLMTIIAMGSFGITFDEGSGWMILAGVLFATVIKELLILFILIGAGEAKKKSHLKSFLADCLFLVFYSLAFTVVIGNTLRPNDYNNYIMASCYSIPLIAMNTFIIVLLFFMLYLPLRIPYFVYERYNSSREAALGVLSICLITLAAVLPLFEGDYSLEDALEHPGEVQMLFLNGRGLSEVPSAVGKLSELRVLHIGFNNLDSIPPEIMKLKKLEWIGLGGNYFRTFPMELLTLPSLKEVDIHYNRIKKLPDDLSSFKKLKSLKLQSNMILPGEKERIRNALAAVNLKL